VIPGPLYSRRQRDIGYGLVGMLAGMLVAFASCSPPETHQMYSPTTEQGNR
jgi:hypothetical protein